MSFYKVGSVLIDVEDLPSSYQDFIVYDFDENEQEIIHIEILDHKIDFNKASIVSEYRDMRIWKYLYDNDTYCWIFQDLYDDGALMIDANYLKGQFYSRLGKTNSRYYWILKDLLQYVIQCRLIYNNIISLHAACINIGGRAIAFSGPSGVGKSTRASRWIEALGATWISGDKPAIDVVNTVALGMPWDGKEQVFRSQEVVLIAVFEVCRAETTCIKRETSQNAMAFLMSQTFIPMWDIELTQRCIKCIRHLALNGMVYKLYSDKTLEAAQEGYNTLCDYLGRDER